MPNSRAINSALAARNCGWQAECSFYIDAHN
jgi:hypothetical protein